MESLEGYWWPAGEDDQVPGRLEVGGERMTLYLNGRFKGDLLEISDRPVVYGIAGTRAVTLWRCLGTGSTIGTGVPRQEFLVGSAWFDVHARDSAVKNLALELEHLHEWSGGPRPHVEQLPDDRGAVAARHVVRPPVVAELPDGVLKVVTAPSAKLTTMSVTLGTVVTFEVELGEAQPFDDVDHRYVRPLRNLLTLAAARPAAITNLVAELPAEAVLSRHAGPHLATIVSNWLVRPESQARPMWRGEFTFSLQAVAGEFTKSMTRWLRAHEDLESACNLFFGNYDAPPRFLETRFLIYCQAAEAFHGGRFDGLRLPKTQHARRVGRVLEQIDEGDRAWAEPALRDANRKSLRERIHELARLAPPVVVPVIGNPEDFAQRVRDLRNDWTHRGNSAVDLDEAFALTQKLRLLLHVWFMRELDLTDEAIGTLLETSGLLSEVRHFSRPASDAEPT